MVKHYTITLSASATNFSAADAARADVPIISIDIQADPANANAAFIGGPGVTTTDYGTRISVPVSGVPDPPYPMGSGAKGKITLSDIYAVGTAGQKLHLNVVF